MGQKQWYCKENYRIMPLLLQQNDMQTEQHICGVDLNIYLQDGATTVLVYNSVPVHNSLIHWSTGTNRAGWVGLLL